MFMEALVQGFSGTSVHGGTNPRGNMDDRSFLSHPHRWETIPASLPPSSDEEDGSEGDQFNDAALKLINQMLMEEDDLENKPCMFQEYCSSLQATEKSFYDVLCQKYPPPPNHQLHLESPDDRSSRSSRAKSGLVVAEAEKTRKKTHNREDGNYSQSSRSNKQLASFAVECDEQLELYDQVVLLGLCDVRDDDNASENGASKKVQQNGNGGKERSKKEGNKKEVVDLRTLLFQCAQAVGSADVRTANQLLKQIRRHSSPRGDGNERLARYFADALEARLAGTGTGTALHASFSASKISVTDILRSYQIFVKACPFNNMSNLYANRSIVKLAQNKTRLHIIDFGILYGFQWPCLVQHLLVRPEGPPRLRITGIDFPRPGFRPAERVEETGRRLATYCERFNVPLEYTAIAKKWETIRLEELKINKEEVLVVNCLYRLRNVPDDTVAMSSPREAVLNFVNSINPSPRDAVLNLVKRINPDLFIHGVLNGTYNAPFFLNRFREALFHYSAGFDLFEATVPREDEDRVLFEKKVFGREIMNVIACEGTERVERPEIYKQWQVRNLRAGFRQLPLSQEIVKDVRAKVKLNYHKDFVVDEDGNWMLQGWKGRIMFALSCWKPVEEL